MKNLIVILIISSLFFSCKKETITQPSKSVIGYSCSDSIQVKLSYIGIGGKFGTSISTYIGNSSTSLSPNYSSTVFIDSVSYTFKIARNEKFITQFSCNGGSAKFSYYLNGSIQKDTIMGVTGAKIVTFYSDDCSKKLITTMNP